MSLVNHLLAIMKMIFDRLSQKFNKEHNLFGQHADCVNLLMDLKFASFRFSKI